MSSHIPVRSPVIRTRDGLIMASAGGTSLLKSSALSGWKTLKWRSESWTAQTTEWGPPSTSITLLLLLDSDELGEIEESSRRRRRDAKIAHLGIINIIARSIPSTSLLFRTIPSDEGRKDL